MVTEHCILNWIPIHVNTFSRLLATSIVFQITLATVGQSSYNYDHYGDFMYNGGYDSPGAFMNFETSTCDSNLFGDVEEDYKCPPLKMLRRHIPVFKCSPTDIFSKPTNCLADTHCCDGSYCCLSVCEGITRCFNPLKNKFTREKSNGNCTSTEEETKVVFITQAPIQIDSNQDIDEPEPLEPVVMTKATDVPEPLEPAIMAKANEEPSKGRVALGIFKNDSVSVTAAVPETLAPALLQLPDKNSAIVKYLRNEIRKKMQKPSTVPIAPKKPTGARNILRMIAALASKRTSAGGAKLKANRTKDISLKPTFQESTLCSALEKAKAHAQESNAVAVNLAKTSATKVTQEAVLKLAQNVSLNLANAAFLKLTQETALVLAKSTAIKLAENVGLHISNEAAIKIVQSAAADLARSAVVKLTKDAAVKLQQDEQLRIARETASKAKLTVSKLAMNNNLEERCAQLKLAKRKNVNFLQRFKLNRKSLTELLLRLTGKKSLKEIEELAIASLKTVKQNEGQNRTFLLERKNKDEEFEGREYLERFEITETENDWEDDGTTQVEVKTNGEKGQDLKSDLETKEAALGRTVVGAVIVAVNASNNSSQVITTSTTQAPAKSEGLIFSSSYPTTQLPSVYKTSAGITKGTGAHSSTTKRARTTTKSYEESYEMSAENEEIFRKGIQAVIKINPVVPKEDPVAAEFRRKNALEFPANMEDPEPIMKAGRKRFRGLGEDSEEYLETDDTLGNPKWFIPDANTNPPSVINTVKNPLQKPSLGPKLESKNKENPNNGTEGPKLVEGETTRTVEKQREIKGQSAIQIRRSSHSHTITTERSSVKIKPTENKQTTVHT